MRNAENEAADTGAADRFSPTLFLYDNYPGGVGLSAPLFDAAPRLVEDARGLVRDCPCHAGCPACVGPILAGDDAREASPKALTLQVLGLFGEA
jgi:DEAD/DEAH box helicase domain-containing protein